jgi:hypothetical protein
MGGAQALVVVVYRNCKHNLSPILANDILIDPFAQTPGHGQAMRASSGRAHDGWRNIIAFGDNRAAQAHTFVANTHSAGATDQALHLILAPATK